MAGLLFMTVRPQRQNPTFGYYRCLGTGLPNRSCKRCSMKREAACLPVDFGWLTRPMSQEETKFMFVHSCSRLENSRFPATADGDHSGDETARNYSTLHRTEH